MIPGKLYRIKPLGYRNSTDPVGGLLVFGDSVNIQVLGSNGTPSAQSEMLDIAGDQIVTKGSYTFEMFPEYICFVGTADKIELLRYYVDEDLGVLA